MFNIDSIIDVDDLDNQIKSMAKRLSINPLAN